MNTPFVTTSVPTNARPDSKSVRVLGWILAVLGPCISAFMAVAAVTLANTIYHDRHLGSSNWHGGPKFTDLAFDVFGAVFLLGLAIFAGGIYQVRTGRRHPVLIGVVLLLAAVTAYLVCSVISTPSTRV